MNKPALAEAVKADLPSPGPNRRKRFALRFAALAVAVAALGAAYWFTRPPELVWWRSPAFGKRGSRVRVLVPSGWELDPRDESKAHTVEYEFLPKDSRPLLLRKLFPPQLEDASEVLIQAD